MLLCITSNDRKVLQGLSKKRCCRVVLILAFAGKYISIDYFFQWFNPLIATWDLTLTFQGPLWVLTEVGLFATWTWCQSVISTLCVLERFQIRSLPTRFRLSTYITFSLSFKLFTIHFSVKPLQKPISIFKFQPYSHTV